MMIWFSLCHVGSLQLPFFFLTHQCILYQCCTCFWHGLLVDFSVLSVIQRLRLVCLVFAHIWAIHWTKVDTAFCIEVVRSFLCRHTFRPSFRNFVEGGQRLNLKKTKRLWGGDVQAYCAVHIGKQIAFSPSPLNETLLHNYVYMNGTCYIQLLYTTKSKPINIQQISISYILIS